MKVRIYEFLLPSVQSLDTSNILYLTAQQFSARFQFDNFPVQVLIFKIDYLQIHFKHCLYAIDYIFSIF